MAAKKAGSTKATSGAKPGNGKGGAKQINRAGKSTAATGKSSKTPPRQSGRTSR